MANGDAQGCVEALFWYGVLVPGNVDKSHLAAEEDSPSTPRCPVALGWSLEVEDDW